MAERRDRGHRVVERGLLAVNLVLLIARAHVESLGIGISSWLLGTSHRGHFGKQALIRYPAPSCHAASEGREAESLQCLYRPHRRQIEFFGPVLEEIQGVRAQILPQEASLPTGTTLYGGRIKDAYRVTAIAEVICRGRPQRIANGDLVHQSACLCARFFRVSYLRSAN